MIIIKAMVYTSALLMHSNEKSLVSKKKKKKKKGGEKQRNYLLNDLYVKILYTMNYYLVII